VYSFPAFVAGAFVFDEVHAYDAKLWGGLLRFLKEFPGVPALLMSASIPPHRQQQLRGILGDRAGPLILGDTAIEGHKRYRLEAREQEGQCWPDVVAALKNGKKVLWVCNTVGDAIRVAGEAALKTHVKPIIYHSRFRYRDRAGDATRKGRQREVLEEFAYHKDDAHKGQRVKPGPSLVIATQVCEMSLDISADLMVTAECPLPALVQRLGRLNRYAERDDPWLCLVYPFKGLPYNEDPKGIDLYGDCIASMAATREAVGKLSDKPCSQRDLAERLDQMIDAETPEMYSALFDDGWVTEPMPVRDGDQSITVIRAADIPEIERALGRNRKWWSAGKLAPWTIPMNYLKWLKPYEWRQDDLPYPVAPDDVLSYSEEEGAQWAAKRPQ
jgi:CRISPR-associated endonuclease/helicase Cas3